MYKMHGFAWYAYPDVFGDETTEATEPGHPFDNGHGGVSAANEVLYFKRIHDDDAGVLNEKRDHGFFVLTRTQLHPKLANGWESEPANVTEGFKTHDGKARLIRLIARHRRHVGELVECEMRIEHG